MTAQSRIVTDEVVRRGGVLETAEGGASRTS